MIEYNSYKCAFSSIIVVAKVSAPFYDIVHKFCLVTGHFSSKAGCQEVTIWPQMNLSTGYLAQINSRNRNGCGSTNKRPSQSADLNRVENLRRHVSLELESKVWRESEFRIVVSFDGKTVWYSSRQPSGCRRVRAYESESEILSESLRPDHTVGRASVLFLSRNVNRGGANNFKSSVLYHYIAISDERAETPSSLRQAPVSPWPCVL